MGAARGGYLASAGLDGSMTKESSRDAVKVPEAKIGLSSASVYPESTAAAFELASRLGYDGVEIMVWTDAISQDVAALRRLSEYHQVPILAIHSPCLLITQRVWGSDPWGKLVTAQQTAEAVGASVVVVHPPFRWQREYAKAFVSGIADMSNETDVTFAVENMFPWKARNRQAQAYLPGWNPVDEDYSHLTLDLSHTAVSGSDAVVMAQEMGERLAHVHLADGTGANKDEHLVPGRGTQRCGEVLEGLAAGGFKGSVILEVNTRKAPSRAKREEDLTEALAFARLNLAASVDST